MKKILLLLLMLGQKSTTTETINVPPNTPVKIKIENNQIANQSNTNTNITTVTTHIKTVISNTISMIQKNSDRYGKTLLGLIAQHKKRIILSSGFAVYLALLGYLYYLKKFMSNTSSWHSWKMEFSFEELATLDLDALSQSLLINIQEKYFKHQDPRNSLLPLILFYNDIEKEHKKINQYIAIATILRRLFLSYFFPISQEQIDKAMQKKYRLAFLKKLFISHMAAQNAATKNRLVDSLRRSQAIYT